MKIGSLFSGYGGLELGVQAVYGGNTAWVSDIDKGACKILAHRFPGVPNIGDMTKVDWSQVEPVDLICGGTPCQDLSHAGKRAGMTEGTRSNLWVAMREAIAVIRPRYVVWENVRGSYSAAADSAVVVGGRLLGPRGGGPTLRALGRVLGDLSDLGYDASWHGLRAADVGAPHGRFRVFVVATDTASGRRGQGWPEPGRVVGRPDVAQRGCPYCGTHYAGETCSEHAGPLLPTPAVNDMGEGKTPEAWDAWTARMKAEHGNGNGHGASLSIEAQRLLPTPQACEPGSRSQASTEKRAETGFGDLTGSVLHGQWGQYAAAIERWEALTRLAPAPTQPSKKGTPQLSAAFSEWMMGLPAGWVTDVPGITRNEALRALGNGVVPQQATAALLEMARWEVAA